MALGPDGVGGVRHLYVHLPFCSHRCGYCDFVTVVGRRDQHGAYVEALLAELGREGGVLADPPGTVFVGGGTPSFTEPGALRQLLEALPRAAEVTVEANPETVTPAVAALLRACGVNRVSLGAQTFSPRLLEVLERVATPDDVRRAVQTLRDASFDNISLDLVYGIPGQEPADLDARPRGGAGARAGASLAATSSRRSRERASPTRGARSSSGSPRRWRGTSSASSRR